MFSSLIEAVVRHILGGFGAFLVSEGVWTQSQEETAIGALVALGAYVLSIFDKVRSHK